MSYMLDLADIDDQDLVVLFEMMRLSPDVIRYLAIERGLWPQAIHHVDCPEDVLEQAWGKPWVQDIVIAHHRNSNAASLARAAKSECAETRSCVAQHPNADPETLWNLALDAHWGVIVRVAENRNTPTKALVVLSEHGENTIRAAVVKNPNCPLDILATMWEHETDALVRGALLKAIEKRDLLGILGG